MLACRAKAPLVFVALAGPNAWSDRRPPIGSARGLEANAPARSGDPCRGSRRTKQKRGNPGLYAIHRLRSEFWRGMVSSPPASISKSTKAKCLTQSPGGASRRRTSGQVHALGDTYRASVVVWANAQRASARRRFYAPMHPPSLTARIPSSGMYAPPARACYQRKWPST